MQVMNREISITAKDLERLKKLIAEEREFGNHRDSQSLKDLETELNRAIVMESKKIPSDTITMNSKFVLINLETREEEIFSLVYPEDADLLENKISIFAPVGIAMIGYKVGDEIEWEIPSGLVRYKIKEMIFQPEAVGAYDL
jgi:regulator of nucleoside diphosphate kinase